MFITPPTENPVLLKQFEADLKTISVHRSYPKSEQLHVAGKVCNQLFLIEKGIARAYYHQDGADITAHFALENEVITAVDSFIQRKPSRYQIELLEPSSLYAIPYEHLQALLREHPAYERLMRLFLEQIYVQLAERIEDLLFHTARERYDRMQAQQPDLLQRVNLKHIASYLGITQETLSRIRGKG